MRRLLLAVLLLQACAPKTGPREDPLAGLYTAPAPASFKHLSAEVISSANTKAIGEGLRKGGSWAFAGGGGNYKDIFVAAVEVLKEEFKEVRVVEKAEDAGTADLLVVLDSDGSFRPWDERLEVKLEAIFLDGGERVDVVRAETIQSQFMMGPGRVTRKFALAAEDVRVKFRAALRASAKLAALSPGRAPAPAARVAAAVRSDVDRPAYKAPEDPDAFALVIGIEKYDTLPSADFAERDAQAMREHLLASGYPERNVVFLAGSKAGKASIEKYVESWLPRNLNERSRLFVYFSGHGAPDPASGRAFLVPWDGDPRYLENTAYPVKRLYEKLGALNAKSVVLVTDACFSGVGGRSVLAKGLRPLVSKIDADPAPGGRLIVLAAAASDEVTGAAEAQGHGLFTYELLRALNASRGKTSIKALYEEARPRVQDAARRENREQTPQFQPGTSAQSLRFGL